MEIRKKLEKDAALKMLHGIKEQICGRNVLELLESEKVQEQVENVEIGKYLLAATMGGLVYFDEGSNCLVQELINPIKSGEQTADKLHYRNNLTMGLMREETTTNEIALTINIIARMTNRSKQIIEKIYGQDKEILQEITRFFFV